MAEPREFAGPAGEPGGDAPVAVSGREAAFPAPAGSLGAAAGSRAAPCPKRRRPAGAEPFLERPRSRAAGLEAKFWGGKGRLQLAFPRERETERVSQESSWWRVVLRRLPAWRARRRLVEECGSVSVNETPQTVAGDLLDRCVCP